MALSGGVRTVGVGEAPGAVMRDAIASGTDTGYCSMFSRSSMQVGAGARLSEGFRSDTVGAKPPCVDSRDDWAGQGVTVGTGGRGKFAKKHA